MNALFATWTPRILSILRIVSAFMFMAHGTQKWLAFPVPRPTPTTLSSLSGVAGMLELCGGFLLLLGICTRPVAFVLSGLMAFAYFHRPRAHRLLADRQPRRAGGAVQFRLPLPLHGGRRAVECRRVAAARARYRAADQVVNQR